MSDKKKDNDEADTLVEHETRVGVLAPWGGDFRPQVRQTEVRKLRVSLQKKKDRSSL